MTRKFVMMPEFDRRWKSMHLDDNDLRRLQEELLLNPENGDVMQGTAVRVNCASHSRERQKRQREGLLCGFCGI